MSNLLELQRPQLLTSAVATRIRDAIVQGELSLGEQVSEAQLAQRLGVSKTPVREALLRLKSEGLVQIHPQRGTFVFRLSAEEVGQLCRFRALLEIEALRESMASGRSALLDGLQGCVEQMRLAEPAQDLATLARSDMEFHWHLFDSCGNHYVRAGYELLRHQLTALRHRSPIRNAVASHQVLVDVIAGGDEAAACALLRGHIQENEPRYRATCDLQ